MNFDKLPEMTWGGYGKLVLLVGEGVSYTTLGMVHVTSNYGYYYRAARLKELPKARPLLVRTTRERGTAWRA